MAEANLKLFMLVLTFSLPLPLLQLSFLPVEIPQDVTIINDKSHLRSCVQVALGNIVYQVFRPLITYRLSGLGNQGKVYRSLITDHSL